MISNQDDLVNYIQYDKIYVPEDYIDSDYKYNFNGDYIIIRTNNNCRTSYNTIYCDCYAYNYKTNVISEAYECTYNSSSNQTISNTYISSDINDSMYIRERYIQDKAINIGIFIIGIIIAILLTKRGAYR